MPIKKNFRDEKIEHFGFGPRANHNCSEGRIRVLSLLATLATIVCGRFATMLKVKEYIFDIGQAVLNHGKSSHF